MLKSGVAMFIYAHLSADSTHVCHFPSDSSAPAADEESFVGTSEHFPSTQSQQTAQSFTDQTVAGLQT